VIALVLGLVFAVASFVQSGPISCSAGEDDTLVLLQSGRALLSGADPLMTYQCGHTVLAPYGIASALLSALGSLAGRVGIWLVWNLIALLLVPLTWTLARAQRWYLTLFVGTSMLYAPLVVGSIQGGHSAIVPVTALLGLWLALRQRPIAGVLAGFLSTVKFPSLFPFWGGLSGTGRQRWPALVASVAVFVGLGFATAEVWGGYAYTLLFSSQLTRWDLSLNEFGVLIPLGGMPPPLVLEVVQGLSLLAALAWVHLRRWPAIPAVALLTVVVGLVAQRFTLNFTVWLLPVALMGPAYTRWLFALGAVAVANEAVALPECLQYGACMPSEGLGAVFGIVLIVLLVMILRDGSRTWAQPAQAPPPSAETEPPKSVDPPGLSASTFHCGPRVEGRVGHDRFAWSAPWSTHPPNG
jgi:hypothetical protein